MIRRSRGEMAPIDYIGTIVTALIVPFDNVLNVHFPRARAGVRIRSLPPAAPVARCPMTDAHGMKINMSSTAVRYSGVSAIQTAG